MTELKPCPFCGGDAELEYVDDCDEREYRVRCMSCFAKTFWMANAEEAEMAWNYREAERKGTPVRIRGDRWPKCPFCGSVRVFKFCGDCGADMRGDLDGGM